VYRDSGGERVRDSEVLHRVRELAIPPAWEDVWICADPLGHLQATGVDAAGRKQYLYHSRWREQRDRAKFRRMLEFAGELPRLRREMARELRRPGLDRERVLACAVRLLDLGMFRIGGEAYAEKGGGLGLATLRRSNVSITDGLMVFDYEAKGGVRRVHAVADEEALAVVSALKRSRARDPTLLAYRDGRRWVTVRSDEINDRIKRSIGEEFTAKDFRTWNATVLAAVAVAAGDGPGRSVTARKRAVNRAVHEVADLLGNTPAVARASYIDPRVFDRYNSGWTIDVRMAPSLDEAGPRTRRRVERAVVDLLTESDSDSIAIRTRDSRPR
jgi:DNA topoisomerase IB